MLIFLVVRRLSRQPFLQPQQDNFSTLWVKLWCAGYIYKDQGAAVVNLCWQLSWKMDELLKSMYLSTVMYRALLKSGCISFSFHYVRKVFLNVQYYRHQMLWYDFLKEILIWDSPKNHAACIQNNFFLCSVLSVKYRLNGLRWVKSENLEVVSQVTQLDLRDNCLESLDLGSVCNLETLHCQRNQLGTLTLSGFTLRMLHASSNRESNRASSSCY